MNETDSIIALAESVPAGEMLAMATVVKVEGSAYRRPGARMLVTASGKTAGMISGGCLESDVRDRAEKVVSSENCRVVTYDSTSPDEIIFGLGLGCNGVVHILIEPVVAGDPDGLIAFLTLCQKTRQSGRMATLFEISAMEHELGQLQRAYYWPDGRVTSIGLEQHYLAGLEDIANEPMKRNSSVRSLPFAGKQTELLMERTMPPQSLVVFGAGDDVVPLTHAAKLLGWNVTVIDARPAYAVPDRFNSADTILCIRPEELAVNPREFISDDSVAVLMTHSYNFDKDLLKAILPLDLRYVGIVGPKHRAERLLGDMADEGTFFSREQLASLHGPAGLDIGAETPQEIALSVIAEIRAVLNERSGGQLRDRRGSIHNGVDSLLSAA
ncbi:MAG: XdhC family protein [Chthonomonadales bacterium]